MSRASAASRGACYGRVVCLDPSLCGRQLLRGHTQDADRRIAAHNAGVGATWTASRSPVTLIYQERLESQLAAVRRERQIKSWSRAKKAALVAGDRARLRQLSARRTKSG